MPDPTVMEIQPELDTKRLGSMTEDFTEEPTIAVVVPEAVGIPVDMLSSAG